MEIELENAQSGMTLAQAVMNSAGMTLAPAGLTLTDNLIEKLQSRGVVHVVVQDPPISAENKAERIAYLFRRSDGDPIRMALRHAVEQYRGIKEPA